MNTHHPKRAVPSQEMLQSLKPETISLMRERDPGLFNWLRTQAGAPTDLDDLIACAKAQFDRLPATAKERLRETHPVLFVGLAA